MDFIQIAKQAKEASLKLANLSAETKDAALDAESAIILDEIRGLV